jgi:hypothetical protein
MEGSVKVVKAIEDFQSWQKPGSFFATVSANQELQGADRLALQQLWAAACDRNLWLSAESLVAGVAASEADLGRRFPWLSGLARQQLARAASYQWR